MSRKITTFYTSTFMALLLIANPALSAEEQVSGLRVRHHKGQTFITWNEVKHPITEDDVDDATIRKIVGETGRNNKDFYRIYRSNKPITTIEAMSPIAEVGPMSCWNTDYYGGSAEGKPAMRYVIRDGEQPLEPGIGLYVHNPKNISTKANIKPMESYYAVTYCEEGRENKAITRANSTQESVRETEGQGVPVLQRIVKPQEFAYIQNPELHYYVRWESPPNAPIENKSIDYLVAIPPQIESKPTPVGLHLHCWGGSLDGGYGWWYSQEKLGTTYLISTNQIPYDWWTGYHESYYSQEPSEEIWKQGIVRPYTTTRILSFLDWAARKYNLDLKRVFTAGSSMGGSGAPMFAIRYPQRIAWSVGWVGVHDPGNTPQFTDSYERVFGNKEWGIKFENGAPVFEYFKDASYLRKYPDKEVGFITWSNGKNDGAIGWPQAVEFYEAMQETRRPHIFVWGLGGHGQRATMPADGGERVMPLDIRIDQSLPAFTNCSLDDDPGTARKLEKPIEIMTGNESRKDVYDGDSVGQINLYLYWDTETVVDIPDRWEMTVALTKKAPEDECTVDITPRRLQDFRSRAGYRFRWSNSSGGKKVQSGEANADKWGLITLKGIIVTKSGNRIAIFNPGPNRAEN
jgi:pimeloyl-ACP methyl ester carboxylesterase